MGNLIPIAIRDGEAAEMLGLAVDRFLWLVDVGSLPRPYMIGPHARWDYARIACIQMGVAHEFDPDKHDSWRDLFFEHYRESSNRYIPPKIRAAVYERDGHRCRYCDTKDGPFHLDHVIPVSRGGESTPDNLTVACAKCNMEKGARTVEEWREHVTA